MKRHCTRLACLALSALLLLGCRPSVPTGVASRSVSGPEPQGSTPSPRLCPQATPEFLAVEPVTSPTDDLSQIVTVSLGNAEVITITAESGTFTAAGHPGQVEVALLPNTTHHLEVVGRVREIRLADGCVYGGYELRTQRDRNGAPLVIQQGEPGAPSAPGPAITPENVGQLKPLLAISPAARLTSDWVFMGPDLFASVGYSDRISLWSVSSGQEMGYLGAGEDAAALCIAAGPDGVTLATGGTAEDRRVRLWEPATGEMVVLGFHDSLVESVAFSPSGKWLASGDNGDRVRIWDLDKRLPETSFQGDVSGRLQSFHNLFWLDDGTLLAAGSDAVYSWDVETGKLLGRLDRPGRAPFLVDVALHPAGGRLAGAAQDGAVYIWDRSTPAWSAWPAPQGLSVTKVQFSPDGQLLAAATQEGELLLWGVEVGGGVNPPLLARYPVVSGSIAAIRFSPDGRIIAVGGWDSPIWLWGIAP